MANASRSYRCFYTPLNPFGRPVATESGTLPFVQLRADNADHARRAAHHVTGCPVSDVERLDHAS